MNIDIFNNVLFGTVRSLVESKAEKQARTGRPSSTDSKDSKVSYNLSAHNYSTNARTGSSREVQIETNNFMSVQQPGHHGAIITADTFVRDRALVIVDQIVQKLELSNSKAHGMFLRTKNMEELQEEKARVKKELINYDEIFKREVGRKPVEKEKEPMKICYLYYKNLKKHIDNYDKREDNWKAEKIKEIYQKLNLLNSKKAELSGILLKFQKNFENAYGRKIKHQSDIVPVKKEHEQYKQLKYDISILYQELNKLTKNNTP